MFFRGRSDVVSRFQQYLNEHSYINFSIITYYEILSGLKHRDAQKQLDLFIQFANQNIVLPLTQDSVSVSADIYANLRRKGNPVDDIDLLIAGVAISNNLTLITHNQRHFGRIDGLEYRDWSES